MEFRKKRGRWRIVCDATSSALLLWPINDLAAGDAGSVSLEGFVVSELRGSRMTGLTLTRPERWSLWLAFVSDECDSIGSKG